MVGLLNLDKEIMDKVLDVWFYFMPQVSIKIELSLIKKFHDEYDVIIDTHTADGVKASIDHLSKDTPMLVLETALPTKFEKTVYEAIGKNPIRPEPLVNLEKEHQIFEVFDNSTSLVKDYILAKK